MNIPGNLVSNPRSAIQLWCSRPNFQLDQDDIDAIQALYGPPTVFHVQCYSCIVIYAEIVPSSSQLSDFPDGSERERITGCGLYQATKDVYRATKGQRSLPMPLVMEAPSSTEQDTREPSQPMISSNFPAENTSSLSSKICPQLIQGTPRAAQGSSKTSFGSGKKTPGLQSHPPRLNPQHHVQWINAEQQQEQQPQLRAKKKFHKWRLLSSLLTAVALALFLVIFYSK